MPLKIMTTYRQFQRKLASSYVVRFHRDGVNWEVGYVDAINHTVTMRPEHSPEKKDTIDLQHLYEQYTDKEFFIYELKEI